MYYEQASILSRQGKSNDAKAAYERSLRNGKAGHLDTGRAVEFLTSEEKAVFYYSNLARLDGPLFAIVVLDPWADKEDPRRESNYVRSLYEDLAETMDRPPISPDPSLFEAARFHAWDMGTTAGIGHDSSDGASFATRILRFSRADYYGENCSYGFADAIGITLQLLIDEGISSLGHRKNLLNADFRRAGISIQPHRKHEWNCVQDFGTSRR